MVGVVRQLLIDYFWLIRGRGNIPLGLRRHAVPDDVAQGQTEDLRPSSAASPDAVPRVPRRNPERYSLLPQIPHLLRRPPNQLPSHRARHQAECQEGAAMSAAQR